VTIEKKKNLLLFSAVSYESEPVWPFGVMNVANIAYKTYIAYIA